MELMQDDGSTPIEVPGQASAGSTAQALPTGPDGLAELVAGVQQRFTQLMAWHASRVNQLEADQTRHAEEHRQAEAELDAERVRLDDDRRELEDARSAINEAWDQLDARRAEIESLAESLHRERDELQAEWENARRIRFAQDQLLAVIEQERERIASRVKGRLDADSKVLEPAKPIGCGRRGALKLADADAVAA